MSKYAEVSKPRRKGGGPEVSTVPRVTLYAVTLYPKDTLAWTGVSYWRLEDGRLTISQDGKGLVYLDLPIKYVGVYAKSE